MVTKNKKINPIAETVLMNLEIAHIKAVFEIERKAQFWSNILLSISIILIAIGSTIASHKYESKIRTLQEDVGLMQCEKDAAKIGAGIVFIAKGESSECHLLYND